MHVGPKKHIVIHKHNHNHKHGHGHKHGHHHKHKHGHKHDHKHKGHHDHKHHHKHKHDHKHKKGHGHHGHYTHENTDWEHYQPESGLEQYKSSPIVSLNDQKNFHDEDYLNPIGFDDDGYKSTKKSVRSEHIEIKELNPYARDDADKYIVRGAYKVQEGDPETEVATTSYHTYDSPTGKVFAQILANQGGRYSNYFPFKEDEEDEHVPQVKEDVQEGTHENVQEAEGEGEGQGENTADHENLVDYDYDDDHGKFQYKNYEDYGDTTSVVVHSVAATNPKHVSVQPGDSNYAEIEKYILKSVYGSSDGVK